MPPESCHWRGVVGAPRARLGPAPDDPQETWRNGEASPPPPRRLPPLLRRAWYGLNQAFRRRVSHAGITPDQYTVLRVLAEHQSVPLPQRDLVAAMSSDPNTVASLLGRMEKQGLVEREPHWKDRRIRCVVLKKQGRRTYRAMRRVAWKLQQDVLSVLPETERERFLEHLERIARSCWAEAHGAGSILEPTRASGHNTQES